MSSADKILFMNSIHDKSATELLVIISDFYDAHESISCKYKELCNADKELAIQYQQMKDERDSLKRENQELYKQNLHLAGIKETQAKSLFGRSSENLDDIIKNICEETPTDPLSEDSDGTGNATPDVSTLSSDNRQTSDDDNEHNYQGQKEKTGKSTGRTKRDFSGIPVQTIYLFDIQELNDKYGEGNWQIAFWEKHESLELVKAYTYLKREYSAVVSVGAYRDLHREPYNSSLIPKSFVSSSLMSEIMLNRYNLFQPLYRMENNCIYGTEISRQLMSYWVIKVSHDLLNPIAEMLKTRLISYEYQQSDETTYLVINDGRKAGTKSYVWCQRSSELLNDNQIVIYSIEKTRSGDHLSEFYKNLDHEIHLSCDAFSAYNALAKEKPGLVDICGCFMHSRRRFCAALEVLKLVSDKIPSNVNDIPEVKSIKLIGKIYSEDEKLKTLTADERLKARQTKVKPEVEKFFAYIHSLKDSMDGFSDKMRDAITYSLNQEDKLRKFLNDGNIPIDNGACEREIKPIALYRNNSLFSTSMEGAEATVITTTLIETAKQNEANPYYYLKYVMERMAQKVYYYQDVEMEELYPWSERYRKYEASQKQEMMNKAAPPGNEKPVSPKIKTKISPAV